MRIAITGTPGTGKTEIARLLAKRIGYDYLPLNQLAEKHRLYIGYDKKRGVRIVDTEKLKEKVKDNVVIDSHFSHDVDPDIIIVLKTHPRELRERMEERGWEEKKIEENMEAEIMEVIHTESLETGKPVFTINTTGKTPLRCVGNIIETLKSRGIKL